MKVTAIDLTPSYRIGGVQVSGYPQPQRYGGDEDGNVTVPMADGTVKVYPWREAVEAKPAW